MILLLIRIPQNNSIQKKKKSETKKREVLSKAATQVHIPHFLKLDKDGPGFLVHPGV